MRRAPEESQQISTSRHVTDDEQQTVADHLRRGLGVSEAFDFVSAYSSAYGYELLMADLDAIDRVRFLFGDPASVEDLDPGPRTPGPSPLRRRA